MTTFDKDDNVDKNHWYDVFYDRDKKQFVHPRDWGVYLSEISESLNLPWFIQSKIYWMGDYRAWLKEPIGVTSHYNEFKKVYIIKSLYDGEGFDADGCGDYDYVEEVYDQFDTLDDVLAHLKKNIRSEAGFKPKLSTVDEYCKQFGFEVYERLY